MQFSWKSHNDIALVLLNNTRQQIKSWSPPRLHHNNKKWTTNSPPIDGGWFHWKGQNIWSTTPPLNAWYLLVSHWGGVHDNESYSGISIKMKKLKWENGKTGECLYKELFTMKIPRRPLFNPKYHAKWCDRLNTKCKVFYEKYFFVSHPPCLPWLVKIYSMICNTIE